jgi:hypothetical protein
MLADWRHVITQPAGSFSQVTFGLWDIALTATKMIKGRILWRSILKAYILSSAQGIYTTMGAINHDGHQIPWWEGSRMLEIPNSCLPVRSDMDLVMDIQFWHSRCHFRLKSSQIGKTSDVVHRNINNSGTERTANDYG